MSTRRKLTALLLTLLIAVAAGALTGAPAQAGDGSDNNQVLVDFYVLDKSGAPVRLPYDDGRKVIHRTSEKDPTDKRKSEVLLDPDTLEALPRKEENRVSVIDDDGHLRLAFTPRKLPSGKGPALALAWPTGKGYSYVVMDNGGQGYTQAPDKPVVFNHQAATDIQGQLQARVAGVPGYQPPEAYTHAFARATGELRKVGISSSADDQGGVGERALTDLHTAYDAFLADYGPRLAQQRMAAAPPGQDTRPWLGATLVESKEVLFYDKVWGSVATATTPSGGQGGYGWVRIVFEYDEKHDDPTTVDFGQYDTAVRKAHEAGLRVMGEVVDSSAAAKLTTPEYVTRTRNLLKHYGSSADRKLRIDAWEVGNEVNGCWVDRGEHCDDPVDPGDRIHNKAGAAAQAVKKDSPTTPVALTLFWELGAQGPAYSPFNWIGSASGNLQWTDRDGVRRDLLADVDVVLLSTFVDNAPMGISIDRVMSTLDRRVSELSGKSGKQVRVGIGELGYWCKHDPHQPSSADDPVYEWCKEMNRVWPLGSTGTDNASIDADRSYMVGQYTRAALATDHGLGGGFYWYALQEMFPKNTTTDLCAALKAVADAVGPLPTNQSGTATPRQSC
ncbi:hypothetical protein JOF56_009982 [Kibdelosporangium banguiense]|uniref:Cellulase (Glycosyl hydrolase family 5) n=1 Tax=Kibdelosporangium banguiense TaxID=1365924 RepID=A0ABS4TYW1_9PSEU|nr:hypothetical protein [Kibdelosporangium banguiense]MBP2329597.1 hypothetical protein [Kibdelosporangium banguiense]